MAIRASQDLAKKLVVGVGVFSSSVGKSGKVDGCRRQFFLFTLFSLCFSSRRQRARQRSSCPPPGPLSLSYNNRAMLLSSLPTPKRAAGDGADGSGNSKAATATAAAAPTSHRDAGASAGPSSSSASSPPPYGKRRGFVPRRLEDFGDGGRLKKRRNATRKNELERSQAHRRLPCQTNQSRPSLASRLRFARRMPVPVRSESRAGALKVMKPLKKGHAR